MGSSASTNKVVVEEEKESTPITAADTLEKNTCNRHSCSNLVNENSRTNQSNKKITFNKAGGKETRFVHSSNFPYKRPKLVPIKPRRTWHQGNDAFSVSYSYNITGELIQCNVMTLKENLDESL